MMDFYDVIFPLHLISKFSGLTLFSVNFQDCSTRFSFLDILFIAHMLAVNYYLNIFFWTSFNYPSYYQSPILKISLPILFYGKYLINVVCITWSIVMRKEIVKLLKMIHDVDEMVKKILSFD